MTRPSRDHEDPFASAGKQRLSYLQKRRAKMLAEVERNRQGDYAVPTWVLVAAIVVIVAGFAALLIFF